MLFKVAHKLDPLRLVPVETMTNDGIAKLRLPEGDWREREGFGLTDRGMGLEGAIDQASYCIKCHNQGKDSCSTGLKEKTGEFKKTAFGMHPRRLSARRKDFRDEHGEAARLHRGSARDRYHR